MTETQREIRKLNKECLFYEKELIKLENKIEELKKYKKIENLLSPGQEPIEIGQDSSGNYYVLCGGIDYVGESLQRIFDKITPSKTKKSKKLGAVITPEELEECTGVSLEVMEQVY